MPENTDRPAPESQKVSDRTNLSDRGPDDKSGTKSMHAVPPNREPGQGSREAEPGDETIRSTESKGANA
jgi:hypothetical protein